MKKISILIVDDDSEDRYLLTSDLEDTGLELDIHERPDGEAALQFFLEYEKNRQEHEDLYPPLIVFLDINMPRMNGMAFLAAFAKARDSISLKPTIFLMLTSSERESDRRESLSYPFVGGYFVKGDAPPEVLRTSLTEVVARAT